MKTEQKKQAHLALAQRFISVSGTDFFETVMSNVTTRVEVSGGSELFSFAADTDDEQKQPFKQ